MSTEVKNNDLSKVNRFGLIITHAIPSLPQLKTPIYQKLKNTFFFKLYTQNFSLDKYSPKQLSLLKDKLYHGPGSSATAAVSGGWYYKTGCCASISRSGNNTRIMYYIPDVGPMSYNKKVAYIKVLEQMFPGRIKYMGKHEGPKIRHPFNKGIPEQVIQVNGDLEINSKPRVAIAAKQFLIVYAKVHSQIHRLLFLQFLRPLYQTVAISLPSGLNIEYYQPQLYFKLKRYFPELDDHTLIYLSFVMSGSDACSTWFPYYTFRSGMAKSLDITNFSVGINSFFSATGSGGNLLRGVLRDCDSILKSVRENKIPDTPLIADPAPYSEMVYQKPRILLGELFIIGNKEAFEYAIKIIECLTNTKYLKKSNV